MHKSAPIEMREIVLVTDGRSNIGGNPIDAARIAHDKGIIVNTIGIVEDGGKEEPYLELNGIVREGGGICDITSLSDLGYSMQMVTRQSVQITIEKAVSAQLKKITGRPLEEMEPESRSKIIEYIKQVGEEVDLKCAILLDCSGSMANKLRVAITSIEELLISFKARKGMSNIAVLTFPGRRGKECDLISGFTRDFDLLSGRLKLIKSGGGTPTYGGIMKAISVFEEEDYLEYPSHVNVY